VYPPRAGHVRVRPYLVHEGVMREQPTLDVQVAILACAWDDLMGQTDGTVILSVHAKDSHGSISLDSVRLYTPSWPMPTGWTLHQSHEQAADYPAPRLQPLLASGPSRRRMVYGPREFVLSLVTRLDMDAQGARGLPMRAP